MTSTPSDASASSEIVEGPLVGLTQEDLELIRTSWAITEKTLEETGVSIFMKFFTVHPHNLTYFPHFRNIPLEQLQTDQKFRSHALKVMQAISICVEHLDDLPTLMEHLIALGKIHSKEHINPEAYNELKDILATILRRSCNLSSQGTRVWEQIISFIFNTIRDERGEESQTS